MNVVMSGFVVAEGVIRIGAVCLAGGGVFDVVVVEIDVVVVAAVGSSQVSVGVAFYCTLVSLVVSLTW